VLLAGYTYLKYLSHPRKLERRPAALYTRRLFGRGVYRAIWEPILRSRFYLHMHAVNMAWFWANLKARSRRFYQGRQMLGYPIGGFHRVTEALVHRISHRGVRVCCGAEVGLLQKTDAGWLVQVNGQPHHFQQVLSTLPGATLARILDVPQADRAYAYKLQAIPYQGVVSLLFTTRQQLTTHYEHYVADTHAPFSMLVHHSALAGDESHGPLHVYYAYGYRPHEDEQMWMDEDELSNLYMEYVQKVFPALDRTAIQHMRLYRKPYAQAVPIIRYSEVQVPFQSPYPGLFVVNFSQLLPYGPTVNAAVEQGRQAARYIGGLPAGGPTAPAGTPVFSSRGPHSS
jgi:protoporphyrinogen oxidase